MSDKRGRLAVVVVLALTACSTTPPPPEAHSRASVMTTAPPPPAIEPSIPPPPVVETSTAPTEPEPVSRPHRPRPAPEPFAPLWSVGTLPVESAQWTDRYDGFFQHYARRHFTAVVDWRWFRAQAIVESSLRTDARSSAGAIGIMQIIPETWDDIAQEIAVSDPLSPVHSIYAGIYYDRFLYDLWSDIPDVLQRLAFTFASYNAGSGRIRQAWGQCECVEWPRAAWYAPAETRRYVKRIMRLMAVAL
ncbi:MAG: transglycosylase SLT domain-containing protein [Spirochaetaceae bacterium]|nr:transglycosylase SLT domain-containing protein [Spirochaetaceae bacterium]